jgi:hypothetical protein
VTLVLKKVLQVIRNHAVGRRRIPYYRCRFFLKLIKNIGLIAIAVTHLNLFFQVSHAHPHHGAHIVQIRLRNFVTIMTVKSALRIHSHRTQNQNSGRKRTLYCPEWRSKRPAPSFYLVVFVDTSSKNRWPLLFKKIVFARIVMAGNYVKTQAAIFVLTEALLASLDQYTGQIKIK